MIFLKKFKKILLITISSSIILNLTSLSSMAKETEEYVYLGGQPFGVSFYSSGVMIIKLESYFNGNEYVCPAKKAGLKINDVIKKVNGKTIQNNEELQKVIFNCGGKELNITVERNGKTIEKYVTPEKNIPGNYLLGVWVRDSCAGIGTITYYDKEENYFAALGHGICDNDTKALMPLYSGETVKAEISSISKSSKGNIGSLNGYFTDKVIGKLTKNSNIGIYGTISDNVDISETKMKLANYSEIRTGKAEVYTTIENDNTQLYSIEICNIKSNSTKSNENFVIKITDKRIIDKCGGIVQGMSGSPIIQNGKLVGAVTHVFINDPTKGYGIIAQNMVTNYNS